MEIGSVIVLSALTVLSGIMLFEFDKSYNTPLINTIFIKSIGALSIVFIGVVIFEESYSYANWLGILMIIIGLYLVMVKP
jgi:multidrug transporter EmrE-like cation transporter